MPALLRSLFIPVLFLLFISLSDCVSAGESLIGDDDEPETATATPTPFATPWPTPTPRVSPTPSPEPTPQPEAGISEEELDALLVGPGDIPTTWSDITVAGAPTEVPGAEDIDGILVSSLFQRSDLGPYLVHMVLYTEEEADAETAFAAIEDELDDAAVLNDITDQVRSWETAPASFEQLGDETFAFKAVGDTGLIPVEADMVGTRVGQYVSFVIHAELMTVDTELTEEIATLAVERLIEHSEEVAAAEPVVRRDTMSQHRWR